MLVTKISEFEKEKGEKIIKKMCQQLGEPVKLSISPILHRITIYNYRD